MPDHSGSPTDHLRITAGSLGKTRHFLYPKYGALTPDTAPSLFKNYHEQLASVLWAQTHVGKCHLELYCVLRVALATAHCDHMSAQEALRSACLDGIEGRLCGREQAKA